MTRFQRTIYRRWLKALRSGRYQQTTGTYVGRNLPGDTCYCAFGVTAVVANRDPTEITGHDIMRLLGLRESGYRQIMHMNDHMFYTFKQIAAAVLKNRKLWFT